MGEFLECEQYFHYFPKSQASNVVVISFLIVSFVYPQSSSKNLIWVDPERRTHCYCS